MGMEKLGIPLPILTERETRNFWNNVDVKGPDECWNWKAATQRNGYGVFAIRRGTVPLVRNWPTVTMRTHRIAFFLSSRRNPNELCILHTCDNRKCCNPAHLFIGTKTDNNRDMIAKGRFKFLPKGENTRTARLTEAQVREILSMRGMLTHRMMGDIYGVSASTISGIYNHHSWKHLH